MSASTDHGIAVRYIPRHPKIEFLGSALYVAAHPDDENTRMISYLSNKVKARTAYLSLTRGDGGQNLIGPELRELLGVLRTQELLAARRVDGGTQFFSRAVDFGYSKHPKETLAIWNKKAILGDVVRMIRKWKPDVIINRFDHRSPGTTHGHHTASALLSIEAFELAGQEAAYSEQLNTLAPWKPSRLFFNTSWWFYGSKEKFEAADKRNLLAFDVGTYYPMLGKSNNEIASLASSQHLCQGFGRLTSRGSEEEYLELLKGTLPENKSDLFEGIDTSWNRMEGGAEIGKILNIVERNFDFKNPQSHLPDLMKALQLLESSPNGHWKSVKTPELKSIISNILGLFLEATATAPYASPGETVAMDITALSRTEASIQIKKISWKDRHLVEKPIALTPNGLETKKIEITIPKDQAYTNAYWLNTAGSLGMYKVSNEALIGAPESPKAFTLKFEMDINGYPMTVERPLVYKYARPDKGELYQAYEIVPEASVSLGDKVIILSDGAPKNIQVKIKALQAILRARSP